MTKICAVYECQNPARTKSLCPKHYMRLHRHGDVHVNFSGFKIYRKARARSLMIQPYSGDVSAEEHRILASVFRESVADCEHGHSFSTQAIGYDLMLYGEKERWE